MTLPKLIPIKGSSLCPAILVLISNSWCVALKGFVSRDVGDDRWQMPGVSLNPCTEREGHCEASSDTGTGHPMGAGHRTMGRVTTGCHAPLASARGHNMSPVHRDNDVNMATQSPGPGGGGNTSCDVSPCSGSLTWFFFRRGFASECPLLLLLLSKK